MLIAHSSALLVVSRTLVLSAWDLVVQLLFIFTAITTECWPHFLLNVKIKIIYLILKKYAQFQVRPISKTIAQEPILGELSSLIPYHRVLFLSPAGGLPTPRATGFIFPRVYCIMLGCAGVWLSHRQHVCLSVTRWWSVIESCGFEHEVAQGL